MLNCGNVLSQSNASPGDYAKSDTDIRSEQVRQRGEAMARTKARVLEIRQKGGDSIAKQEAWLTEKLNNETEEEVLSQIRNSPNKEAAAHLLQLAEKPIPRPYPSTSAIYPSPLINIYLGMPTEKFVKIIPDAAPSFQTHHFLGTRGKLVPWIFQSTQIARWELIKHVFYRDVLVGSTLNSVSLGADEYTNLMSEILQKFTGFTVQAHLLKSSNRQKIEGARLTWTDGASYVASATSTIIQVDTGLANAMASNKFSIVVSMCLHDFADALERYVTPDNRLTEIKTISTSAEFLRFFPIMKTIHDQ